VLRHSLFLSSSQRIEFYSTAVVVFVLFDIVHVVRCPTLLSQSPFFFFSSLQLLSFHHPSNLFQLKIRVLGLFFPFCTFDLFFYLGTPSSFAALSPLMLVFVRYFISTPSQCALGVMAPFRAFASSREPRFAISIESPSLLLLRRQPFAHFYPILSPIKMIPPAPDSPPCRIFYTISEHSLPCSSILFPLIPIV